MVPAIYGKRMKVIMISLWIFVIALFVAAAAIPNFMVMEGHQDTMLHITGFCIMMMVPAMLVRRPLHISLIVIALFGVGVGVEFMQSFVDGRSSSLRDVYANIGGLGLGLIVGYLLRPVSPDSN